MGKQWKQCQTLYFWAPKLLQMMTAAMKSRGLLLGRKDITTLDSVLKKNQDIIFAGKDLYFYQTTIGVSSSWVWM